MFRTSLCAFALLAAGAFAAHADATVYKDPAQRFDVTVPDGWQTAKPDTGPIAFALAAPKTETSGGLCLVQVKGLAETRNVAQADIDNAMDQLITKEFWTQILASSGSNADLEDSGTQTLSGRKAHYVVASVDVKKPDGTVIRATSKQVLFSIPGSMHFVSCTSKKEHYAVMAPQFDKVFASYVPRSVDNIAEAAPRSVLTLYAGNNFDGVAHVVAQDTANIPALAGIAASAGVAGVGQWEVCDGVNFTGTCRRVAAAYGASDAAPRLIASARRIKTGPIEGVSGVIAAASAVALQESATQTK